MPGSYKPNGKNCLLPTMSTQNKVREIGDGKTIALTVGVCQLLNSYSAASLSSQHLRFFPTSVLKEVATLKEKLHCNAGRKIGNGMKTSFSIQQLGLHHHEAERGSLHIKCYRWSKTKCTGSNESEDKPGCTTRDELQHDWENMHDTITLVVDNQVEYFCRHFGGSICPICICLRFTKLLYLFIWEII